MFFFFFSFLLRLLFIFPHLLPPTYPCLPIEIYMIIFSFFLYNLCSPPLFNSLCLLKPNFPSWGMGTKKGALRQFSLRFFIFLSFFILICGDINNNAEFIYLLFCYLLLFPLTVLRYLAPVRGFPSFSRSIPYHT